MKKIPLIDLYPVLQDGSIVVEVSEATNSHCNGTLTVEVAGSAGESPKVLTKQLTDLNGTPQNVLFAIEKTGKIHPVTASLTLDSGEIKTDSEIISLQ